MVWLLLLILIAPVAIFTAAYNRLALGRIALRNAFAQMDVLLTRRQDLVPNLIESVREHLGEEIPALKDLLADCEAAGESLKQAAAGPDTAAAVHQLAGAERRLDGALGALWDLAQRHPVLNELGVMASLSEEVTLVQQKVATVRQAYNSAVMTYNHGRLGFPGSLAADFFGFAPAYPLPEEPAKECATEAAARLGDAN